jgi:protein-serine/threonine kinase
LTSEVDTSYFPVDEINQVDHATVLSAHKELSQEDAAQDIESPDLSLPFIGYTFKRFDNNFQ